MADAKQSRPVGNRTAGNAFEDIARVILPGFDVDGMIYADLRMSEAASPLSDAAMARTVQTLAYGPPGAKVIIHVPGGQHVPSLAVAYLRAEGRHLASVLVVSPDPQTVGRWVQALRGQEVTSW